MISYMYRDLWDGTIWQSGMMAEEVQHTRDKYMAWDPEKFAKYFKKMLQKAVDSKEWGKQDYEGLLNDRKNHPIEPFNEAQGYPRWEGSDAEHLLKQAMDDGSYKQSFSCPKEFCPGL